MHQGVYADFTGPLPWKSRVWAAWLACGPAAALTGETALRWYGLEGEWADAEIHLAVPHARRMDRRDGIRTSRHRHFDSLLVSGREPPLVRLEVALLVSAAQRRRPDHSAARVLDACRQGRTTAARLRAELELLPNLPGRRLLWQILSDAATGVQSFLEQTYLRRVERAHALPVGRRQLRAALSADSVAYRDVEYARYDVVVELDGRRGHADVISSWRDMRRNNATSLQGKTTLRFGYQLVSEPCLAAAQVATALTARGWPGPPRPCSPACAVRGGS